MENHLLPGTVLQSGRYKIERVLGQGGFGITYQAVQTGLSRTVAIKEFFIPERFNRCPHTSQVSVPSVGSQEMILQFKEKFVKEAQTIASMNHPHIVHIFDVFEENGTAYYVMEHLGGGVLSDRVSGGGMPYAEALGYIRQLCDALGYIHSQNILHLDIKPSNVMFRTPNEVVLIDFGISKHYDASHGGQTSMTPFGLSRGYAPLEQNNSGGLSQFSPATDIYSLGATLYALLTGNNPPDASDVMEYGLPPFPVSVPSSMIVPIDKAMQSRRKDRPQSIAEFVALLDVAEKKAALSPISSLAPTVPSVPEIPQKVQKRTSDGMSAAGPACETSERKSRLWILWVLLSLLVVIGVGVGVWLTSSSKKEVPVIQSTGVHKGHSWVDLGLPSGLKWATCNIGADRVDDAGDYFSWGDTLTKSRYDSWNGSYHDVAQTIWEGDWRMPTKEDFEELMNECSWTWVNQSGRQGYKVTSRKNGNSIFLPASGLRDGWELVGCDISGNYWTSTPNETKAERAYSLQITSDEFVISKNYRKYGGLTVRPVLGPGKTLNVSPEFSTLEETAEEVEEVMITEPSGNTPYISVEAIEVQAEDYKEPDEDVVEITTLSEKEQSEYEVVDYEEEVVEEETIPFQLAEEKPSFNGGDANEFSKWVNQRLVYPEIAKENGVQGRVTLQFTVEKDGRVTKVKVLRGVDPSLDQEAVRVVSMSPKWKPGKQRDRAVAVTYTFPVIFQLR